MRIDDFSDSTVIFYTQTRTRKKETLKCKLKKIHRLNFNQILPCCHGNKVYLAHWRLSNCNFFLLHFQYKNMWHGVYVTLYGISTEEMVLTQVNHTIPMLFVDRHHSNKSITRYLSDESKDRNSFFLKNMFCISNSFQCIKEYIND